MKTVREHILILLVPLFIALGVGCHTLSAPPEPGEKRFELAYDYVRDSESAQEFMLAISRSNSSEFVVSPETVMSTYWYRTPECELPATVPQSRSEAIKAWSSTFEARAPRALSRFPSPREAEFVLYFSENCLNGLEATLVHNRLANSKLTDFRGMTEQSEAELVFFFLFDDEDRMIKVQEEITYLE